MFESKEEYGRMVESLYAECEGLGRGDTLRHGSIRAVLGVGPNEGHWQHCMDRLRVRMERERGISMWPEVGVGYRLCTESEQVVDIPIRRLRRARRQIDRGVRSVRAVPESGLSLHDRRARLAQIDRLRAARREVSAQLRAASPTLLVADVLPRRRPALAFAGANP